MENVHFRELFKSFAEETIQMFEDDKELYEMSNLNFQIVMSTLKLSLQLFRDNKQFCDKILSLAKAFSLQNSKIRHDTLSVLVTLEKYAKFTVKEFLILDVGGQQIKWMSREVASGCLFEDLSKYNKSPLSNEILDIEYEKTLEIDWNVVKKDILSGLLVLPISDEERDNPTILEYIDIHYRKSCPIDKRQKLTRKKRASV
jgi:hypothetical protein